jgi:mono/diheme cytochrome c family protein
MSVVAAGLGVWIWQLAGRGSTGRTVSVKVPELSALAVTGKDAFDANCAACHGPHAAGTDKGPPLVHVIYNAGHHADEVFVLAAKVGVRQHHWRYGDMPPLPQVTPGQMEAIVRYVRELQAANGIAYRPRGM